MTDRRRTIAGLLLTAVIAVGAGFLAPRAARAQGGAVQVLDILHSTDAQITEAENAAKKKMLNSLDYAITTAMLTAVNTMTQRLAQTTATWIASGDWGQGPLIFSKEFGAYGKDLLLDTASDALNTFTKTFAGFGICDPLNPKISLRVKLGIARVYVPKPSCTWAKLKSSGLATYNNFESGKFLQNISASVEMGQSPLSFAVNTQFGVGEKAQNNMADKLAQRLSSNGFKNLTDPISGNTKTPAAMIQNVTETQLQSTKDAGMFQMQATINHSQLFAEVGANALRVFTSTLVSKYIDKYLKKGMITGLDVVCKLSSGQAFDLCKGKVNEQLAAGGVAGSSGEALASAYFASIFTPTIASVDDYGPLNELSACPGKDARGIWNCVIDQSFVSALSPNAGGYMSVRDAVAKGLLNGGWELVPPSDPRNGEYDCYTKAFCYTNLVKLRRMRVIPSGWEMAAVADTTAGHKLITLKQVMDAYATVGSPYYGLIDPDWVLKVPATQCRQMVPGQTLSAPNSGDRADVCVDAPSCVEEDVDGKCVDGYGYCTRERSVWKVDATACPAQYASCNSYSDPNGKQLSVLDNTVDASACNADNAGCKPFSLVASNSVWGETPSIYLSRKAPECDAANAGCRPLEDMSTALTANLLPNPSFETPTADGTAPAGGWGGDVGAYSKDGSASFDEWAALTNPPFLAIGGYLSTADVELEPNQLYTLSFYAKGASGQNGRVDIKLFDRPFRSTTTEKCPNSSRPDEDLPTCLQDLGAASATPTCQAVSGNAVSCVVADTYDFSTTFPRAMVSFNFPLSFAYDRYTLTFATPANAHYFGGLFVGNYSLDAVQLEKGPAVTAFHVGGFDKDGAIVNIKTPPDYLACTGEASDAGKGCSAYAPVCRQSEVGCSSYTPAKGGVDIPAVTSSNDVCDAKCVGYSTFKQEQSVWDGAPVFPLYFIPSTAKSCQLSEVGCDEFTNLEAVAQGGEARAYFTSIRACRKPDAGKDGAYFIWEGSDTGGYQLKSFVLRQYDATDSALMNVPNNADSFIYKAGAAVGPAYLAGTDLAACTRTIFTAKTDPDCRELIDADGNIFYRLLTRTVTSTDDCKTYRKTVSAAPDCAGSGGSWDAATNVCDYWVYSAQSRSCSAAVKGCRAYTGDQGNNTRTVFTSNFENNQTDGWSNGVVSSESTAVGGHSYTVSGAGYIKKQLVGAGANALITANRSYTITLWAKGIGAVLAYKQNSSGQAVMFNDTSNSTQYVLGTEWQRYVLGPIVVESTMPVPSQDLYIGSIGPAGVARKLYIDNIELTETQDRAYLVRDSWKTPFVCDTTPAGQPLAQAQLNCAEYSDQNDETLYLKSFDHLCREQAVGCKAFADRQGTATPFASYFNAAGPATVTDAGKIDTYTVPADTTRYLVDRDEFHCDTLWCAPLGDKDLNTTASIGGKTVRVPEKINGKTVYRVVDPSAIGGQLCSQAASACEVWSGAGDQKKYFKNPGAALCEYREKQTVNGADASGWFKKGTTAEPCDPAFVIAGSAFGIYKNGDPQFVGFAGVCKEEAAGCTEFVDRADTTATANGRPFYYIKDGQIDDAVKACKGLVSQKQGCVALDETADPRKTINSAATNDASAEQGNKLIAPISDGGNDANIIMKVSRDRVCTEWLECNTEQVVSDPTTGRDTVRCLGLGSCVEKGADGRCSKWGKIDASNAVLSQAKYASHAAKALTYKVEGSDYSGFSIPNMPSVDTMRQIQPSQLKNIFVLQAFGNKIADQTCKVYPESDAPFPKTVLADPTAAVSSTRKPGFNNANVCENGDCECSYRKAVYSGSLAKYFPLSAESGITENGKAGEIKSAVCVGGPYDGAECNTFATGNHTETNPSCINGQLEGNCAPMEKVDSILGEAGYCLERDATLKVNGSSDSACITWLPIDSAKGRDTANQFTSAAFIPKVGQERYCSAPAAYCAPHDCANPSWIPALCTELQATEIRYNAENGDQFGNAVGSEITDAYHSNNCFDACNRGTGFGSMNGQCQSQEKTCGGIVKKYCDAVKRLDCAAVVKSDPSCATADAFAGPYCAGLLRTCQEYTTAPLAFCASMEKGNCYDNYGYNAQCSHDMPGIYLQNAFAHYNDSFATRNSNASAFCGLTRYGGKVVDLASCSVSGTQFCGNGISCPAGQECAVVSDLSVRQTEFTKKETYETYGCYEVEKSVDGVTQKAVQCDIAPLAYTNIAGYSYSASSDSVKFKDNTHTFFGSHNAMNIPTLSSPVLKFTVAQSEGDWVNIKEAVKIVDGKVIESETSGKNALNVNPETVADAPVIGSFPIDLVGLYYYGKSGSGGSASVTYDLAQPSLLLLSQVDRVSVKIMSDAGNGLCQYGAQLTSGVNNYGACYDETGNYKAINPVGNDAHGYEYNAANANTEDDARFTPRFEPSYAVLSSTNNWTYQVSGNEGAVTLTAIISQTEPKRMIGIRVDLEDNVDRGYLYIAGLDVHLRGPVCGEAVYVGSSNPAADNVPKAFTNAVNAIDDYTNPDPLTLNNGIYKSFCNPFGAFASTNPSTIVTTSIASSACELAKGAIYAGVSELKRIFARAFWIKTFNDAKFDYSGPSTTQLWDSASGNTAIPAIAAACEPVGENCRNLPNVIAVNNMTSGLVSGIGSYRANIKFYATANEDHLPIKSVQVKWNDGTDDIDPGTGNYYKNHDGGVLSTGSVCASAELDSFAHTPAACDPKPFSYSHVYAYADNCLGGSTAGAEFASSDMPAGVEANDSVCVFKPTVTVTDNWGVNNGSTASGARVVVIKSK